MRLWSLLYKWEPRLTEIVDYPGSLEEPRTKFGEGLVYCWSCSQHQLSCCISLCALFAEPRVGKAQAKRLEEDTRSRRNCRHVYSLLAGAEDAAAAITSHNPVAFQVELICTYRTEVAYGHTSTLWCTWAGFWVISAVTSSLFTKCGARARDRGVREPNHTILASLLLPLHSAFHDFLDCGSQSESSLWEWEGETLRTLEQREQGQSP